MSDEPHLSALDATFLELEEADESAHMHIGGVLLFESQAEGGPPALDRVRAEVMTRLGEMPRYRQRLSSPRTGGLHWPRWQDDQRFDIARHVTEAGLPQPGGERELLDWASDYFSQRLERSRPLWEIVLLTLADGRWAMVTKTHHCMVDGVGSVDVARTLLDTRRDPPPAADRAERGPMPGDPTSRGSGGSSPPLPVRVVGQVTSAALDAAGAALHAAGAAVRRAVGAVEAPIRDPHASGQALSRARAMVELLITQEVISAPETCLNDPIGTRRRLAVFRVPLADLKDVKRSLGGTVNDVVLAATASGLRELLGSREEALPPEGLRAMVPVNIRSAGEQLALGNRVTSLFVALPLAEGDPLVRYRRQVEEAEGLKAGSQATGSATLIDLASHAPPALHSFVARSLFATRLFNLTITNVPGPQTPLYCLGSRMLSVWPVVPLAASHSVGLAVFSYDGELFFCLNADRDSVPELDLLAGAIRGAITELRELADARGDSSAVPATRAD